MRRLAVVTLGTVDYAGGIEFVDVEDDVGVDVAHQALLKARLAGDEEQVVVCDSEHTVVFRREWVSSIRREAPDAIDVEVRLHGVTPSRDRVCTFRVPLRGLGDLDQHVIPFEGGPIDQIRIRRAES